MSKHQKRHANAYRAGGRKALDDMTERLMREVPTSLIPRIAEIRHELRRSDDWRHLMAHEQKGAGE